MRVVIDVPADYEAALAEALRRAAAIPPPPEQYCAGVVLSSLESLREEVREKEAASTEAVLGELAKASPQALAAVGLERGPSGLRVATPKEAPSGLGSKVQK